MKLHQSLSLDQLQPGMKLALAVTDKAGAALLPAGAELSEGIIASLGRRGIEEITIELEMADDPIALAAVRQAATERLAKLFRKAGQGEATRALHQALTTYRLGQGL